MNIGRIVTQARRSVSGPSPAPFLWARKETSSSAAHHEFTCKEVISDNPAAVAQLVERDPSKFGDASSNLACRST